jgi:hypothetical protein
MKPKWRTPNNACGKNWRPNTTSSFRSKPPELGWFMERLNDVSVPHCGREPAVQNFVAPETKF